MSQGTSPYQPSPAGMPGMNSAADQEIQKKATNAIIAAIVGIFCCPLVQIYTIMTANEALARIQATGAGQQHQTLATIAKVVGIVHLALVGVGLLIQILVIALGAGAAAVN